MRDGVDMKAIGPRLVKNGLIFVGLDVIGEHLTEVNVTSPTGIQELGRFTGTNPCRQGHRLGRRARAEAIASGRWVG